MLKLCWIHIFPSVFMVKSTSFPGHEPIFPDDHDAPTPARPGGRPGQQLCGASLAAGAGALLPAPLGRWAKKRGWVGKSHEPMVVGGLEIP